MTSGTDAFDDDYDEYDGFDDEDNERGVSGLVVLLIILGMLLAFSFIVWLAYNKGVRQGTAGDIPQIAADPEPVKTIASNDSGAITETREVYDRFDGNTTSRAEVLGDGPEEPILAESGDPIADIAASAGETVSGVVDGSVEAVAAGVTNVTNSVVGRVEGAAAATGVQYGADDNDQLTSIIDSAVTESEKTSNAGTGSVGTTSPTQVVATRPVTTSTSSFNSTHLVQVGAFRSEVEADNFWNRLSGRFGGYLDGKTKDIERADLGEKGIYYRLRIAGFDTKSDASTYCDGLKARNQDCLVKARQ